MHTPAPILLSADAVIAAEDLRPKIIDAIVTTGTGA